MTKYQWDARNAEWVPIRPRGWARPPEKKPEKARERKEARRPRGGRFDVEAFRAALDPCQGDDGIYRTRPFDGVSGTGRAW